MHKYHNGLTGGKKVEIVFGVVNFFSLSLHSINSIQEYWIKAWIIEEKGVADNKSDDGRRKRKIIVEKNERERENKERNTHIKLEQITVIAAIDRWRWLHFTT